MVYYRVLHSKHMVYRELHAEHMVYYKGLHSEHMNDYRGLQCLNMCFITVKMYDLLQSEHAVYNSQNTRFITVRTRGL